MRLSSWLFICLLYLQQPAYGLEKAQDKKKITLKGTYTFHGIFQEIEKQAGLKTYYTNNILNDEEKISINFSNISISEALSKILHSKNLEWSVEENYISIRKRQKEIDYTVGNTSDSTITVIGRVVTQKGDPLIGANILIKGTTIGTATNSKGEFKLNNVSPEMKLIISNIGYLTSIINVNNKKDLGDIKLSDFIAELDEAAVIGYGITSKRVSTGSFSVVTAKEIGRQPVVNPLYALQGKVPGMLVTPSSGLPGAPVSIQIRGQNSLSQSSNPLYIVNGLPYPNMMGTLNVGLGALGNGMSPLNYLNINDIESITVLKDADATAIYGSRGANGVILITTKKAKARSKNIDINIQHGISQISRKVKMMDTKQYLSMRRDALHNDGLEDRLTNPSFARTYADLVLWDQNKYTDWQEELIGNNATYTDVQTSIMGGGESVGYSVGGNYHKETTVFPGNHGTARGGAHFSITGDSENKKFKVILTGSYLYDKTNLPSIDYTSQSLTNEPNAPSVYNEDGTINWALFPSTGLNTTWQTTPYSATIKRNYQTEVSNLTTSSEISYNWGPLIVKSNAGYSEIRGNSFKSSPLISFAPSSASITSLRSANYSDNFVRSISIEPQLNYQNQLWSGRFEFIMGAAFQSILQQKNELNLNDYSSDALLKNKAAAATVSFKRNENSQYKYAALFARMTYTYQGKYLVNLNARRDGSSRFGPGNQFGTFGAIGVGWILSGEKFAENLYPTLSFAKIRVSYGTSGNDGIGDYRYLEQYESTNINPYLGVIGYQTKGLYNPYYHWETTKKFELGLELGLFNDRMQFTTNLYRNRSNNQLINYPTPFMAGFGFLTTNLPALIQNSGLELSLNSINIKKKNFTWSSNVNFTINRNKLIKYPDLLNSAYATSIIGEPFWGFVDVFKSAGVDQKTGIYQFATKNGEIVGDPNTNDFPKYGKDIRIITAPRFFGGISNSITFKSLTMDIFFQFIKQRGINPLYQLTFPGSSRSNQFEEIYGRQWSETNENAPFMKFSTTGLLTPLEYQRNSDQGFVDASFLRLKNFSISYIMPSSWLKQRIKQVRIYLQGQNVVTFTKYKGLDPETQSLSTLPPLRTIVCGLQIGL